MDADQFDSQMRAHEIYHEMYVLASAWPVIRVDGRSFSKYTQEAAFTKPFDEGFRDMMATTALALFEELGALYIYTESDEISILLPRDTDLFGRSVEKLVSISAAVATSAFTLQARQMVQFDSRLWVGANIDDVVAYFSWRQADAARCALNGWCYWTLRQEGLSARAATAELFRASTSFKNELLFERDINFNELPLWQRRGIGIRRERVQREGYNPLTEQKVIVWRSGPKLQMELAKGEAYREYIAGMLTAHLEETTS